VSTDTIGGSRFAAHQRGQGDHRRELRPDGPHAAARLPLPSPRQAQHHRTAAAITAALGDVNGMHRLRRRARRTGADRGRHPRPTQRMECPAVAAAGCPECTPCRPLSLSVSGRYRPARALSSRRSQ
jgi:hypothetical protein